MDNHTSFDLESFSSVIDIEAMKKNIEALEEVGNRFLSVMEEVFDMIYSEMALQRNCIIEVPSGDQYPLK